MDNGLVAPMHSAPAATTDESAREDVANALQILNQARVEGRTSVYLNEIEHFSIRQRLTNALGKL